MKKLLAFLLALVLAFGLMGCEETVGLALDIAEAVLVTDGETLDTTASAEDSGEEDQPEDTTAEAVTDQSQDITAAPAIDEDGFYYSAEDVALYLYTYGQLPENFITKSEARELGWEGGSVEDYAPDCAIGGDKFGNREGLLPEAHGRQYYECDIDTHGADSRGAKRIVFSNDGLIYYTEDHYESFELLYGEE